MKPKKIELALDKFDMAQLVKRRCDTLSALAVKAGVSPAGGNTQAALMEAETELMEASRSLRLLIEE